MTPKSKKIIAREGLILFGFLLLALFIKNSNWVSSTIYSSISNDYALEQKLNISANRHNFAIYFPYPLYLVIRFIIWAVKTLKQK